MSTSTNASAHATMAQSTAANVGRSRAHPVHEGWCLPTALLLIARTCGVVRRVSRNGQARRSDHSPECGAGTDVVRLAPA